MFGLGKYTVWKKDVNEVGYKPPPKNFRTKNTFEIKKIK